MNGSGILMLAVGLAVGLMLGSSLKQCAPIGPVVPVKGGNFWDVLIAGMPIAKDIFD
jgi:hypothetical protein